MELETKLMTLTCDANPSEEKKERVAKFLKNNNIDWNCFFKLISQNKTYNFVLHNFKEILPKEFKKKLALQTSKSFIHHERLLKELTFLFRIFRENEIPLIVLKGIPLSQELYNSPYLRPTSDIDLLIKKRDLEKACSLLTQAGYKTRENKIIDITKIPPKRQGRHLPDLKKENIKLDLHRTLTPENWDFDISENFFWERTYEVKIDFNNFTTLNPELLFIHLCIHAIEHSFMFILLYDISLTTKKYELDWNKIYLLSKRYKLSTFIYYILLQSIKIYDVDLPKNIFLKFKKDSSIIKLFILKKLNFPESVGMGKDRAKFRVLKSICPRSFVFRILSILRHIIKPYKIIDIITGFKQIFFGRNKQ